MKLIFNYVFLSIFIFTLYDCRDGTNEITWDPIDKYNCQFSRIDETYTACLSETSTETLDIVTWNIEFLSADNTDFGKLIPIILNMNADVIAVQEINNIPDFLALSEALEGWEAKVEDISGTLELGLLYKSCEIASINNLKTVTGIYPRPAVMTSIVHVNGLEVTLMNIHLKCCNDGEDRRESASEQLKAYIDNNLSAANVILLGDYNDDINDGSPFTNFIADKNNYRFADMNIATGSPSNWSYPSYPSHIDHVLMTNELFDNFHSIKIIHLEGCMSNYYSSISDHRAVMASFSAD